MSRSIIVLLFFAIAHQGVWGQNNNAIEIGILTDEPVKIKTYTKFEDASTQNNSFTFESGNSKVKLNLRSNIISFKLNFYEAKSIQIEYIILRYFDKKMIFSSREVFKLINVHNGVDFSFVDNRLDIRANNNSSRYLQFTFSKSQINSLLNSNDSDVFFDFLITSDENYVMKSSFNIESGYAFENNLIEKGDHYYRFNVHDSIERLDFSFHRQYSPSISLRNVRYSNGIDTLFLKNINEYIHLSKNLDLAQDQGNNGAQLTYKGNNKSNSQISFDIIEKSYMYNVILYGSTNSSVYIQSNLENGNEFDERHQTFLDTGNFTFKQQHYLQKKSTKFSYELSPLVEENGIVIDSIKIVGFREDSLNLQVWTKEDISKSFKEVRSLTVLKSTHILKGDYIFKSDRNKHQILILLEILFISLLLFGLNAFFARNQLPKE